MRRRIAILGATDDAIEALPEIGVVCAQPFRLLIAQGRERIVVALEVGLGVADEMKGRHASVGAAVKVR